MGLVERAKNIIVSPKTEWDVIAAEATPAGKLVTGYVLPLAAAAALAAFIGMVFIGISVPFLGTSKLTIGAGLAGFVMQIVMAVVMVFVLGFIIDALAPTFGGTKDNAQAVKVAAYAYTPVWIVGLLAVIPALGVLGIVAAIYAIYLLYLGLPRLMRAPQEKAAGYTAVVVVVAIVVGFIAAMIVGAITTALSPAVSLGGVRSSGGSGVTFDKDSPMGKLDDFAKKMEEAAKKAEAAQKSGDPAKQAEAALGALGTALSGGKGVEPVQVDALRPFLPERIAGLSRGDVRSDRSGVAGLMSARVEAEYGSGDKRVEFEVVDTGGAVGLLSMAAAAAAGMSSDREDGEKRERMRREGNRVVHEEISKRGGPNKYTVVLADRYLVSAEGQGVSIDELKSGVASIDLGKLEALR